MQRSHDDTWNQARIVRATATFGVESTSRVAEV
jgi:hypothetical protein